jgi:hypothetical protein
MHETFTHTATAWFPELLMLLYCLRFLTRTACVSCTPLVSSCCLPVCINTRPLPSALPRLSTELSMIHEKKVIVFVNTKRQCDNVYAQLEGAGYSCTVLHGGRNQDQREVSGSSVFLSCVCPLSGTFSLQSQLPRSLPATVIKGRPIHANHSLHSQCFFLCY